MTSYLAKKAAEKQAETMAGSLLAPLLSDDESSYSGSGSDDEDTDASSEVETEKRSPLEKLKELAVYVVLGGGVALSAASMVFAPVAAIFVMGAVCIANVPYSAFKERAMGKIPSLRAMNNKLRDEANKLGDEVDFLGGEIDVLEPEADRAFEVEEQLRDIAGQQQANVDHFVELVKENEIILAKMRENIRQRIMQDMICIVVKSDRDNDRTIDRTEAKMLALSIRLALQEYNVVFDSQKFLRVIGEDASVEKVIGIVQKLMPQNREEEREDSDSESSDGSWSGSDSDDDDDDYDMFHMSLGDSASGAPGRSFVRSASTEYGECGDGSMGVSLMRSDQKKRGSHRHLGRSSSHGRSRAH